MVTDLTRLVVAYRTVAAELRAAEDEGGPDWSPIRAACLEPDVNRLAREIADLLAARNSSVLV